MKEIFYSNKNYFLITITILLIGCSNFISSNKMNQISDNEKLTNNYEERKNFKASNSEIKCIIFNQFGTEVAIGNQQGYIKTYNLKTFKNIKTIKAHDRSIYGISFYNEDQNIVTGSRDNQLKIWDLKSYNESFIKKFDYGKDILSINVNPKFDIIAYGGLNKEVKFVIKQREIKHSKCYHQKAISSLSFDYSGCTIASAGWDKKIKLWDTTTFEKINEYSWHNDKIRYINFDKRQLFKLASCGKDKLIFTWDTRKKKYIKKIKRPEDILKIQYDNESNLISINKDQISFWDNRKMLEPKEIIKKPNSISENFGTFAYSKNYNNIDIIAASIENNILIWEKNQKFNYQEIEENNLVGISITILDNKELDFINQIKKDHESIPKNNFNHIHNNKHKKNHSSISYINNKQNKINRNKKKYKKIQNIDEQKINNEYNYEESDNEIKEENQEMEIYNEYKNHTICYKCKKIRPICCRKRSYFLCCSSSIVGGSFLGTGYFFKKIPFLSSLMCPVVLKYTCFACGTVFCLGSCCFCTNKLWNKYCGCICEYRL